MNMLSSRISACLEKIPLRCIIYRRTFASALEDEKTSRSTLPTKEAHHEMSREIRPHYNKSFLKNIFTGIYEPESLIFPEILSKSELAELKKNATKTKMYFESKDDGKDLFTELKELGLIGSSIDEDYGGKNFQATKVLRLYEEISDENVASLVYAHNNIGVKCINCFGSDEIKDKYLPKLTSGKSFVAFCVNEEACGSDLSLINTKAYCSDEETYQISGEKSFVVGADKADLFVVFAKTIVNYANTREERLTGFIIEKNDSITISESYESFGNQNKVFSVKFDNTNISKDNVIGEVGSGYQVIIKTLYEDLYLKGGLCCGILKNVSKQLSERCIKRKVFGKSLKDFGMIQDKLANLAMNIYAIESMSYMTAGIVDSFVYPDITCESAAIKIFASESLFAGIRDAIQTMGSEAYKPDSNLSKLLLNAANHSLECSSNELLRLFISSTCLQHAGSKENDHIGKKRNAFNNVGYIFKDSWINFRSANKLHLKLYDHVHPDLSVCGEVLEPRISRLKHLVVKVLSTSFINIQDNQFFLKRFADIAIGFYAVNSVLARASRSKAIGLKNCDNEIMLVQKLFTTLLDKIDKDLNSIDFAYNDNGDVISQRISDNMVENAGFAMEHPLTKNW